MQTEAATTQEVPDLETLIARAKRAFALKQLEQAATLYATALENYATDCTAATVDIYYLYGCALLENAIASNAVLGNNQEENKEEDEPDSKSGQPADKARFNFGADGDEDPAVDLFAQAEAAEEEESAVPKGETAAEGDEEEEEPEDDFNAAWEILDLARTTYESMPGDESKLKLAATYMALGDISLETEKFDQAVSDYTSGLAIKADLLPHSSRQIAEAHFRLSLAYDMTSGKLLNQIEHVEKALSSVKARLQALRDYLWTAPESHVVEAADSKGKGKEVGAIVQENPIGWTPKPDGVERLIKSEVQAEIKDVVSLCEELEAKLEDIKATPEDGIGGTTMDRVGRELDLELNGPSAAASANAPVNDLTSMVRKKKPKPAPEVSSTEATSSLGKRKAEDEGEREETEKKQKID